MITLTCTSCKKDLPIDDAFAGGVCRCQYCGTIQTVPSSKGRVMPKPAKALYQGPARGDSYGGSSTGLEQLGEAVSSSGLSSGRLKRPEPAAAPGNGSPRPTGRRHIMPYVAVGGGLVLILAIVGTRFLTGAPDKPPVVGNSTDVTPGVPPMTGVSFLGLPLAERSVVFLIDRGPSSAESFGVVADALGKTLAALPADARFQVILWDDPYGPDVAIPASGLGPADKPTRDAVHKALDQFTPIGESAVDKCLKRALAAKPGAVVIVTAKGWMLREGFVATVQSIHGGAPVKIHTVAIGDDNDVLRLIADKTGGQYRRVTNSQLADYAK